MVAAVLVAAIAAFANYAYLDSVQDRANDNAELLKVFVVAKEIAKATPGEQAIAEEFIRADEIPRKFRPGTAITDVTTLRSKVALTNLSVGQVVVDGMFVNPVDAQITFAERIPAGHMAMTVQIDQVRGVAGLLVPGDLVNILVRDGANERFLFQNAPILAIGTSAAPQAGDAAAAVNPGSGLITFAVTPEAAQRLALAASSDIYFALVPRDNQVVNIPPASPETLFEGSPVPGTLQ